MAIYLDAIQVAGASSSSSCGCAISAVSAEISAISENVKGISSDIVGIEDRLSVMHDDIIDLKQQSGNSNCMDYANIITANTVLSSNSLPFDARLFEPYSGDLIVDGVQVSPIYQIHQYDSARYVDIGAGSQFILTRPSTNPDQILEAALVPFRYGRRLVPSDSREYAIENELSGDSNKCFDSAKVYYKSTSTGTQGTWNLIPSSDLSISSISEPYDTRGSFDVIFELSSSKSMIINLQIDTEGLYQDHALRPFTGDYIRYVVQAQELDFTKNIYIQTPGVNKNIIIPKDSVLGIQITANARTDAPSGNKIYVSDLKMKIRASYVDNNIYIE